SQLVTVRFSPTVTGSAPGTVAFTSNGGNVSRPVTGTGGAVPVIAASLDSRTGGAASRGGLRFTVQNTGGSTLTGSASTSAPYSIASGASFNLGPGASQLVVVRFSPTVTGSVTGTVAFTSNGGNVSRPVTGTGGAAPVIAVTPSS